MTFLEAIQTCFRKYVDFNGRAGRAEYWYFVLFSVIVNIVASGLDSVLGIAAQGTASGPIAGLASLALLLPGLGVAVRRMHDIDKSGWWLLLVLIPLVGALIVIFAFLIKKSQEGDNRFGPAPTTGQPTPGHANPAQG